MSRRTTPRLRQIREERGLSQVELAAIAGLTRQSIGAIEAGRTSPSVDAALRIARALDSSVEELFQGDPSDDVIVASNVDRSGAAGSRLVVGRIEDRWVAHALEPGMRSSADAIRLAGKAGRIALLRPPAELRENVVVLGCAPGLGLLTDRASSRPGVGRFRWLPRSSTRALEAFAEGTAHVAGVHLVDTKTGEANVADVRKVVRGRSVVLITFARWEVGFVVAAGNPKAVRRAEDLGRSDLRIVARESGAGARRVLDRELGRAGRAVDAKTLVVDGHFAVAQAVAIGAGDVGIATRDVAIDHGLTFVPLAEERYDLVVATNALADARLQRLLDVMTSGRFRRELTPLGYDLDAAGNRVTEIHAA